MVEEAASDSAAMTMCLGGWFDGAVVASDLHSREQTTRDLCQDFEFKCLRHYYIIVSASIL